MHSVSLRTAEQKHANETRSDEETVQEKKKKIEVGVEVV